MSRPLALALLLALGLGGAGCVSEQRQQDREKAHGFGVEAKKTQAVAASVSRELVAAADRLDEARAKRRAAPQTRSPEGAPAVDALEKRVAGLADGLKAGQALLEAIEDAEITFRVAERFYEVRDSLDAPPPAMKALEQDVAKATAVARRIVFERAPQLVGRIGAEDAEGMAALEREIERDRAALKTYRTDLNLIGWAAGVSR
jgi:hypothetical protein